MRYEDINDLCNRTADYINENKKKLSTCKDQKTDVTIKSLQKLTPFSS
jgi:hypothetical protein